LKTQPFLPGDSSSVDLRLASSLARGGCLASTAVSASAVIASEPDDPESAKPRQSTADGTVSIGNLDDVANSPVEGPRDISARILASMRMCATGLRDAPDIDASYIEVRTNNGEVTLSGSVNDREQKRRAEDLIEVVSGVRDSTTTCE
jgi:hypothetical protein